MAFTVPQPPGGHMTPKSTKLSGPGGYSPTVVTTTGSAGALKPMGGGTATRRKAGTPVANRIFPGRRGSDPFTSSRLKNIPRTIVP